MRRYEAFQLLPHNAELLLADDGYAKWGNELVYGFSGNRTEG